MPEATRAGEPLLELPPAARATLRERVELARARAAAGGRAVLAGVTVAVPAEVDVSAIVLRSRRADDRYFCFEQPERDDFALGALGEAVSVETAGERRFDDALAACRRATAGAVVGTVDDRSGDLTASGPVWVGASRSPRRAAALLAGRRSRRDSS